MFDVTRRYGVFGGSPRKSEVGDCARRAQSMGLCPGSSVTCREGFLGMDECMGGSARLLPREEEDGAPRRGMGRLLRSRLGEGSSVGMRRGAAVEEGEDEDDAMPANCGMLLGRGFFGTGGGGIMDEGDGDDAGAGAGVGCVNEGGAGRFAVC